MQANPKHLRAVIKLGEDPQSHVECPRCGVGRLQAYQQVIGRQRFVHIWCSANEDHYQCIDGPREELFAGVPDVSERETVEPAPRQAEAAPAKVDDMDEPTPVAAAVKGTVVTKFPKRPTPRSAGSPLQSGH